jgi:hypothetical protein
MKPVKYDLNLNMLINEISVGTSYRSDEAIIVLFEYQISRKMRVDIRMIIHSVN